MASQTKTLETVKQYANQLHTKYSNLSLGADLKPDERIRLTYKQTLLDEINDALGEKNPADSLKSVLAKNWDRVKGSFLIYTAQPDDDVTRLLCEVATYLESINPDSKLTQQTLENIRSKLKKIEPYSSSMSAIERQKKTISKREQSKPESTDKEAIKNYERALKNSHLESLIKAYEQEIALEKKVEKTQVTKDAIIKQLKQNQLEDHIVDAADKVASNLKAQKQTIDFDNLLNDPEDLNSIMDHVDSAQARTLTKVISQADADFKTNQLARDVQKLDELTEWIKPESKPEPGPDQPSLNT